MNPKSGEWETRSLKFEWPGLSRVISFPMLSLENLIKWVVPYLDEVGEGYRLGEFQWELL